MHQDSARAANHRSEKKKNSSSRSTWICFCGVFTKGRCGSKHFPVMCFWCSQKLLTKSMCYERPQKSQEKHSKWSKNGKSMTRSMWCWQLAFHFACLFHFCFQGPLLGSSISLLLILSFFLNFKSSMNFLCLFSLIFVKLLAYKS